MKSKNERRVFVIILVAAIIAISFFILNFLSNIVISSEANIRVITISGEIMPESTASLFGATKGSRDIVNQIESANNDPSVDGVLLVINSPGGTPVASHEIVRAVKNLQKPSVALIREVGASGAYWVASAADHIISDELSLTGSVGVLGGYLEFSEFLERYNISYERVTGGEYKDIGSPFRPLSDEERVLLQEKVDIMHSFFIKDVVENRGLTKEQADIISTGIYFVGLESVAIGLVDELGSEIDAKNYFEETLKRDVNLVRRQERTSFFDMLLGFNIQNPLFASGIFFK